LKAALVCLLLVPMVLPLAARTSYAETLVLAAAPTKPTAFLVDDKPTGILVDLVTEAFRRAGDTVEIHLLPWARCLSEARTGEIDGVFSSFKLPEREEFLTFSHEVLTTQIIAFFARRDWTQDFDGDLGTLRDAKIGVINGTSYGEKFDSAAKTGTLRNIEAANSIESNLGKLVAERVDLIPSYRYVALDAAKRLNILSKIKEVSPSLQSMPSYLAFTKARDLSRVSNDFDAALAAMKQDGTYDRIVGKYNLNEALEN
jgi:polar amino acid transport system substrate-binding protein